MDMKKLKLSGILFGCFAFFTLLVAFIDRKPIGPAESKVGWAKLNDAVSQAVGRSSLWYGLSQFFGFLVIIVVGIFACLGVYELIRTRSLLRVDADLYALAIVYAIMAVFYVLFEKLIVNYRPVLEDGELAASYPSSHTLMAVTVLGTAAIALYKRLKDENVRKLTMLVAFLIMLFSVLTRFLSGVHWFTDIIGAFILGASLVAFYVALAEYSFVLMSDIKNRNREKKEFEE